MIELLGVPISPLDMKATTEHLDQYIDNHTELYHVVTANPEIVMNAERQPAFQLVLGQADLITPDGIGVVIASRMMNTPLPERVPGYDLIQSVLSLRESKKKRTTVYALGAQEDVIKLAVRNLRRRFECVEVVGYHHGYFEAGSEEERSIVGKIETLQPDLLLVGLGSPRQEMFIHTYRSLLGAKLAIGCGGSFDVMAGTVKRAPEAFRRAGLEWLYRLMQQPSRLKRQLVLPLFLLRVLQEKRKVKNGDSSDIGKLL